MGNILYIITLLLVFFWLIGYFGYKAGGIFHVLIVVAVIVFLIRVIAGRKIL